MLAWLVLLASIGLIDAGEYDFTVEIRPGKYECFFQTVSDEKHKNMEIDYQVIEGGDLNINFLVMLGADVLIKDEMETDGSHKISINSLGDYQFCFDNTFSYNTRKVVFFEVYLTDADGTVEDVDVTQFAKNDAEFAQRLEALGLTLSDFHAVSSRIKNSLNKIEYYQSIMKSYEHRDKVIMKENLSRVTWWSMLATVVLLVVATLQVYIIRSLFEENSKLGRLLRK